MAYDETLAERIRGLVRSETRVTEKKMFGGLAFLNEGAMFLGVSGNSLMARIGLSSYENALKQPYVRVMDFTGRVMKGYVYVDPQGLELDEDLSKWVDLCLSFVKSLPPKKTN